MKLTLKRKFPSDKYTVGELFIDGKFFCNTIEDKVRKLSVTCEKYGHLSDCLDYLLCYYLRDT